MRPTLALVALLAGCGGTPPEPTPKAEPASTCDVTLQTLPGTAWVHLKPQPTGPDKPSPVTRMRFRDEGGRPVADYTASSLSAVYVYDCQLEGTLGTCMERDNHAVEWCRAWAAVNNGTCDPAAISQVVKGIPEADWKAAAEKVNKEIAAMKKNEREETLKSWNYQNNKIRGVFKVAVDAATCRLTVQDKYQTMYNGKVLEYENQIGTAKFQRTKEDYLFEDCKDLEVANAILPEGATARAYPAGTYEFESFLPKGQKADAACTYSADIWFDWLKQSSGLAGTVEKGNVRWVTRIPVSGSGPHVVHFDRTRTCGGATEKLGLSCAKIHIE